MSYLWLNGYFSSLSSPINSVDGILPVNDAANLATLLISGHTYLTLNDGTGTEIVKAESFGTQVKITRGQDGTTAKAYPAGTCVKWEATRQGIKDTVCSSDFDCCGYADDDCKCGGCNG